MSHELAPGGNGSDLLSGRELEVLTHGAKGLTAEEVGRELSIAQKTAKNHLDNIYTKLDAVNRLHAVLIALRLGVFSPAELEELRDNEVMSKMKALSKAERKVLETMVGYEGDGSPTEEVGKKLHKSAKTVKNQQQTLCNKLGTGMIPAVVNYYLYLQRSAEPTEAPITTLTIPTEKVVFVAGKDAATV